MGGICVACVDVVGEDLVAGVGVVSGDFIDGVGEVGEDFVAGLGVVGFLLPLKVCLEEILLPV